MCVYIAIYIYSVNVEMEFGGGLSIGFMDCFTERVPLLIINDSGSSFSGKFIVELGGSLDLSFVLG